MSTELQRQVEAFALELSTTLRGVLTSAVPEFAIEASPARQGDQTRLLVQPSDKAPISLTIDGEEALALVCEFTCIWDHRETYLKVTSSKLHVTQVDGGAPLFRYEFTERAGKDNPVAHLHVHAHRDEILYALLRGPHRRARKRADAAKSGDARTPPRLSNIHFPLGGARMRPCLEDVLEMLMYEFGIDVHGDARSVIAEGRARWRRHQTAAAVRDAPAEAVRVLRALGFKVEEPDDGPPPERTDRLERF